MKPNNQNTNKKLLLKKKVISFLQKPDMQAMQAGKAANQGEASWSIITLCDDCSWIRCSRDCIPDDKDQVA